ncbi:hypothetical protein CAC42_2413 [Sphaceloma murrayae]|uniref:NmrA-like domain-containing protein n=1 Tax=Sphaceloma murrayae TaxID=2082308 RepID=A0A2K1QW09_9PEZI|nr:hypothetical protein CAC42_2413 [Sphaceloma murrayae]
MSIKRVAVQGGTGNLGPFVVDALVDAGFQVDVLSRSSTHPDKVNKSATIKQVDPTDNASVTAALKGVDAFVSVVGNSAFGQQSALIDAAIAAGVKFFIPSEFGSNTENAKTAALPVFGAKIQTQKYLEEKKDKIGYAFINNGAFLDWGIKNNFILNISGGVNRVYDGGDVQWSGTNLSDIGKAVAGVLKNTDKYNGKFVHINTTVTSQNKLLAAAKKAGVEVKTEPASTAEVYKGSMDTLQSGKGDIGAAMLGFIINALYDPSYGNLYEQTDSKDLGIKVLNESELEELVAEIVKAKK